METIKSLYIQLSEKNFKIISIIFLILGDISICSYLWLKLTNRTTFDQSISMANKMMNLSGGTKLPPNFAREIYQLLVQSLVFAIAVLVSYHLIIYLLFHLKKKFAYGYLKIMFIVAIPGLFIMGVSDLSYGYFVVQSFLFLYVFLGITKFFPLKS